MAELCEPWADKERIICAYSFFASVEAAEILSKKNLRFTGIIKTATSRFPISHFGRIEMFDKGDFNSLFSKISNGENESDVVSLCWLDRNRRHFVSTAGRTSFTVAQERVRWRQHEDGACPVEVSIAMPELVSDYYAVAGIIDAQNRIRQDSLDLEKTVEVKEWSFRINTTLLGMVLTDTWLLYKFGTAGREQLKPHQFWSKLGHELAFNSFDSVGVCRRPLSMVTAEPIGDLPYGSDLGIHLTPTKKTRLGDRSNTGKQQRRCTACPRGFKRKSS